MSALCNLDVSRETIDKLEIYAEELRRWNPKINLVAKSTMEQLWERHFVDSAQLVKLAPEHSKKWADFGSGGGFPGLVVAIITAERQERPSVTLVESDARKCTFLRTVLRKTSVHATVLNSRIEDVPPLCADVISARALADLSTLFALSEKHAAPECTMLFPKGKKWREELMEAQSKWCFDCEVVKSETQDESVILRISGVKRA